VTGAPERDVVIVGAGITGLALATRLVEAGADVVVLEARDRVGGRLLSVPAGDGAADLGASWFWADETRVHALVRRLDLPVHAQHLAGDALFQVSDGVQRLQGNESVQAQLLLAEIAAYRGEADAAFAHLEAAAGRAVTTDALDATLDLPGALWLSPFLAPLREDARWLGVVRELSER
jgi:monoamine oxidase